MTIDDSKKGGTADSATGATNEPLPPSDGFSTADPRPSETWLASARFGLRTSVKLVLGDLPEHIEIRDSVGSILPQDRAPSFDSPALLGDWNTTDSAHPSGLGSLRSARVGSVGSNRPGSFGPGRIDSGSPGPSSVGLRLGSVGPRVGSVGPGLGSFGPVRRDSLGMHLLAHKDSWSPESRPRRRSPSTARDLIRSVTSWVLLLAVSLDVLALALEPLFVTRGGAPLRPAIAAALASVGLSLFFAIVAAPVIAGAHALVRYIGRLKNVFRFLWPSPLVLLAWLVVSNLAPHKVIHSRSLLEGQLILAGLLCASLIVGTAITRIKRGRLRVALGLSMTAFAFWLNAAMSPVLRREPRDLLWISTIFCFASVLYPLRRHVASLKHEQVSRMFGYLLVVSIVCLEAAPIVASDWRMHASIGGRFAPRLARFVRLFGDLDMDGFSGIAWGTDCDDNDSGFNPAIRERLDGLDRNCNGKIRPKAPTPADRGLAPAFGEPDAKPDEIDRVVLITIDCFRNDGFTEEYTPNLVKLAARGLVFKKLYSSGARTAMSLPLLLRGSVEAPTVAAVLALENVSSTALFGYNHPTVDKNVFDGFQKVTRPPKLDQRIRAPELTDLAIADLRDPAHAQRHFLWVHYFDAHGPRSVRVLPPETPRFPPIVGETDDESAVYLSELAFIDSEIARLIEAIDQNGGLARTVVIMTNDHGEGFGRHSVYEHGVSAFEAITHAPGFIVAPGIAPGAYVHVAAQRDIAATVLGAFGGVSKHPEIETFGRSWLRFRADPKAPLHEFVFTYETTSPFERWADAPMASIVDDQGKLSVSYVDGITRFYRLDYDPTEDFELSRSRPAEVARYRDKLELFRDIDAPVK